MRARTVSRILAVGFGLVLSAIACGRTTIDFGPIPDGGDGTGGAALLDGSAGSGGTGNVSGTSGGGGAGGISGSGGDGGSGGDPCYDQATSDCQFCTCDACYDEWTSCDANAGCLDILACADKSGCSGIQCYLGPCQQVIDQNGGPFGNAANAAQAVGQCRSGANCPCGGGGSGGSGGGTGGSGGGTGGFGGFGGFGGSGGSGGSGATGGSGGSGGGGPLQCITCIAQKCPAVQECLFDNACRDGAICAFQNCLGSGGGGLNLQCMLGCFNGDFSAALKAFQAFQCFFSQCGGACSGGIPGFPGLPGGGGGGTPPPNP